MPEIVHTDPNVGASADIHLNRLLAESVEEPWFKSLINNIKDTINPPKLPPLELTSKPVAVKDIWGLYGRQKKSFFMSTGVQFLMVGLLIWAFSTKVVQDKVKTVTALVYSAPDIPEYQPKLAPKKQAMAG